MNEYLTILARNFVYAKVALRKFMSLQTWRGMTIITAALALPLGGAVAQSINLPTVDVTPANQASLPVDVSYVPIVFRRVSGIRPFVEITMNGKPFQMMVHANATLYAMTTHANADMIGLSGLGKQSDYGISSEGNRSDLGRTSATLESLRVGDHEATNVRLSVFEVPQDPKIDGMLGINWLRSQRAIVDYDAYRVGTAKTAADSTAVDGELLKRGYIAHKMTWDPVAQRYSVQGALGGVPMRLAISTVAESMLDSIFAQAHGIQLGPVVDQEGGPKGSLVDSRITKYQLQLAVDGQQTAPVQPLSFDPYAYSSVPRPEKTDFDASLGADFMLANQAVIDFGSEILFVAPSGLLKSPQP